jgi:hypothetical protein
VQLPYIPLIHFHAQAMHGNRKPRLLYFEVLFFQRFTQWVMRPFPLSVSPSVMNDFLNEPFTGTGGFAAHGHRITQG